ncbi:hypothetical protein C7B80_32690 [Cyanosarcina cf. burmensis CCALA 770]|nr:hypothetical protein C7B80_32690 [Cyanosarcina cf. burmensis CCALA 770]
MASNSKLAVEQCSRQGDRVSSKLRSLALLSLTGVRITVCQERAGKICSQQLYARLIGTVSVKPVQHRQSVQL